MFGQPAWLLAWRLMSLDEAMNERRLGPYWLVSVLRVIKEREWRMDNGIATTLTKQIQGSWTRNSTY